MKNEVIDNLLHDFVNIVIRKFIFSHEHPYLSGGLLFFSKNLNRINNPHYKINNGEIIYNMDNKKEKGEIGEIFELLSYGKIFHLFKLFDLLFMANEKNDDLDIDTHLKIFNEYRNKKKDLKEELRNFPKDQILSDIVKEIFDE